MLFRSLRTRPIAEETRAANEQHYEVPTRFYQYCLGKRLKYSGCLYPTGRETLDEAEELMLALYVERARIADGQEILELGCGWGSLSLYLAEKFPGARITGVSNSATQREHIEAEARRRGLSNLRILTRDMNSLELEPARFDRVVSVEMFEHLRNWPRAFAHVARWLRPGGRFFLHVFAHREAPYAFEPRDASDWMARHFFTGGMMPGDDLALRCQDDLRLLQRWRWNGRHYARTAAAWLQRMDAQRHALMPLFERVYGVPDAARWWTRWRLFFLSVEELFAHAQGGQWWVSHYLFEHRP